ncbi:MAG: GntR family transcriptional regulator [Victivallaceae bacterium]
MVQVKENVSNLDENDIYTKVLHEITSGSYPSGSRILEKELSSRLGVSRIPLREALSRLIGEGILCSGGQYRGIWLRRYNATDIRCLYEYRTVLEAGVARLVAQSADEIDILQLRVVLEKMEELSDLGQYETDERSRLDRRFHHELAVLSGNQRLVGAVGALLQESRFLFYRNPIRDALLQQGNEVLLAHATHVKTTHREIFESIAARNPDRAEEAIRNHFREAAEIMIYAETVCQISSPKKLESK